MKTLAAAAVVLALVIVPAAAAGLVTHPKNHSLAARAASQEANLAHARYVCRHGRGPGKLWACSATTWLARELAETLEAVDRQHLAGYLDRYLAGRGSPLAGYGRAFVASGYRHHLDPRLALAISAAETTFGQSGGSDVYERHNAWGWGPHRYVASTWPAAIELFTAYLRSYYVDARGLTSLYSIMPAYVGYSSSTWIGTTTAIMRELGGDPAALTL